MKQILTESLLVPLINDKLPHELLVILAQEFKEGLWSLEGMLQRLKIELEAKERSRTLESKLYPPYEKYSTTSSLTVSSNTDNRRCSYCSGLHPPAKCQKISEPNARKNCLRKKGNCFICLKHGHTSISCPSNYKCFKCGGKHHISICIKERHFVRPLDNEERKTEYVDNTHVNTHLSTEKSNGSNGVLLQTAQAELVISMVMLEQMAGYILIVEVSVRTLKKK